MDALYFMEYQSPIGPILLLKQGDQIVYIKYGSLREKEADVRKWCQKHGLPLEWHESSERFDDIVIQLEEYFQQKRTTFTIPYKFYGTSFQQKVWQALATKVDYGKTCSYQDIANYIESPKAVRAVGGANNKNPISIIVPCHRVIGKNGKLVGYGGGLDKKEYLLSLEQK
ncbi:methylated-DNA--[protein]-cysteine S-methyltransferase [Gracilibacillus salinarum]|uniref:methylated-DNA--[protein]-cysteine S-methyltransferase n=1 Tax=Gracilibacillus salinarum TaxID=2932255 RepID=UPI00272DD7BC|nr:methylated-DNA--[protein]-cysteine S-methyltransferase [Gracilibacillus salinarum]